MRVAFISHANCIKHDMGQGHPESPLRLQAIEQELKRQHLWEKLQHYEAPIATLEQLARAHAKDYIQHVEQIAPHTGQIALDPDTSMNAFTWQAALHAAGAVVSAVDLIINNTIDRAFCSVRPPGHHAEHSKAMGFCLFNNIAVAVSHALACYDIKRVAIIDFDVHHGNGTEDIFKNESRVMLCSTFQHPYYPYSGAESGNEHIINMPLKAGSGNKEFRIVFAQTAIPALQKFQPQLIFVSAGYDAHQHDPLAQLNLTDEDYRWVMQEIIQLANEFTHGKLIMSLEGGYHLEALAQNVCAQIKLML